MEVSSELLAGGCAQSTDWEQSYGGRLEPDETGPHKKGGVRRGPRE